MQKTESLRRQVLFLTIVFVGLGLFLVDSYFGVRASAQRTLSRIPASIASASEAITGNAFSGAVPAEATKEKAVVTILKLDCRTLSAPFHQAIPTKWVQLEVANCKPEEKLRVINQTNGFDAILFKANSKLVTDLITLTRGDNQIGIFQESSGSKEPFSFSVIYQ